MSAAEADRVSRILGVRGAASDRAAAILEISDLITDCDPVTGERRPVRRAVVLHQLSAAGDKRGARIAARIPSDGDLLDPLWVDRLLVRVHTELQRLSEELRMGERLAEVLVPLIAVVRQADAEPIRIVDVGCGLGYSIRWLASSGALGPGVRLTGIDLNGALVAEAARLAAAEDLDCEFRHADALDPAIGGQLMISSGLLHHLRGDQLAKFFARHDRPGIRAFCHYDIAATSLAPLGARLFHRARMRESLGRHDGVASARRAHPDESLLAAARAARGFEVALLEPVRHRNLFCATVRPVIGVRDGGLEQLQVRLGRLARSLIPDAGHADSGGETGRHADAGGKPGGQAGVSGVSR
jgi:SAM-dependent methyltransferase